MKKILGIVLFAVLLAAGAVFADIPASEQAAINDLRAVLGSTPGYTTLNGHVDKIGITNKGLTSLPESIGNLTELTVLSLYGNNLTSLPDSIGNLTKLERLILYRNSIGSLPSTIGNLASLRELVINDNKLTSLPESLCNLVNLETLRLNNNRIAFLPTGFGNLMNLRELNLEKNYLTSLPDSISELKNNDFDSVPALRYNLLSLEELKKLVSDELAEWMLQTQYASMRERIALDELAEALGEPPWHFLEDGYVVSLRLTGRGLTSLPECVASFTNLRELYLSWNRLASLPESMCTLTNLQVLNLDRNEIESLPENFGSLTGLKELYLNNNYYLTSLPESFGNLVNLEILHLDTNEIEVLPENFGNLTGLKELYLNDNRLTSLPENFGNLANLEILNLGNNIIRSLPTGFGNLASLRELYLASNILVSLPENFGNLTSLERLNLEGNYSLTLSESICGLTNLRTLILNHDNIGSLPANIGNLKNLEILDLSYCDIAHLPESICTLTKLRSLDLTYNHIDSLPANISDLTELTTLKLRYDALTSLPDSIADMTQLRNLDLDSNNLASLPEGIGRLKDNDWASVPDLNHNMLPLEELKKLLSDADAANQLRTQTLPKIIDSNTNPKSLASGTPITINDAVVYAKFGSSTYVMSSSGAWGIRVMGMGDAVGRVNLTGWIYTDTDSNGESFIRTRLCTTVDPDAKVSPVFMKNKSLGGGALGHQAGVEGSEGVNNVGMYVRTSGKVVSVDGGFFNIDDGSGNPVRATRTKVMNVGDYVTVTGAVSLRSNEGKRFVELLTTEYAVIREAPKPEQPE